MARDKSVLDWKQFADWGVQISELLDDVLTSPIVAAVRANPPPFFSSDSWDWLEDILEAEGGQLARPMIEILAERLPKRYVALRARHACRPTDVADYYRKGLLPLDPESFQELARTRFLRPEFPEVSEQVLNDSIAEVGTETRKGRVHFGLDDDFLVNYCGHYLIDGSEYLSSIAVNLQRTTGRDYTYRFRQSGIPTVFVCDLPFKLVDAAVVSSLSSNLLSDVFEAFVMGQQHHLKRNFGFAVRGRVDPSYIVSHYHPAEIPDPHAARAIYRPPYTKCKLCG